MEKLQLPCSDLSQSLILNVYDHDMIGKDDFLGTATVPLSQLDLSKKQLRKEPLLQVKSGVIHFEIEYLAMDL